jgi:hypothetical protein
MGNKEGHRLLFNSALKKWEHKKAIEIALTFDKPECVELLRKAWSSFSGFLSGTSTYDRFHLLDIMPEDLRELAVPKEHYRYGVKAIRKCFDEESDYFSSASNIANKIGYIFSDSELKTAARKGSIEAARLIDMR